MSKKISTDSYKGTRDFYPKDMSVQEYIFTTWAKTAESFGFEHYGASILEPSDLYRSKSSDEIVNEQTYTFTDRGDREVTLRPEMTPTVARMVAGRLRELTFPVRWYSIPNLFRYERPQRGRLREHWQLNCDLFGIDDSSADVEIIALAHSVFIAFGATEDMFEIRINDRALLNQLFKREGFSTEITQQLFSLLDRKDKIKKFDQEVENLCGKKLTLPTDVEQQSRLMSVMNGLSQLGITNVVFSPSIVRGFNYYTDTIFEIFDTSKKNNRSMLGGGRYNNLISLFDDTPVSGVGFGMGDVTMRDFLETHTLLPKLVSITAPTLMIIPTDQERNIVGEKIAQEFRTFGLRVGVDLSDKKIGKKISSAHDARVRYVLIVGENEIVSQKFVLKELETRTEISGTIVELANHIT